MRVLVIGGSGFIGSAVVSQLAAREHETITVQRRRRADNLPRSIRQFLCDQEELLTVASELRAFQPEVVIDVVSSSARQARVTAEVFAGHAGRLIAISSQDVYKAFGIFHGTEEGPLEPVPLTEKSPVRTNRATYPPELLRKLRKLRGWVDEEYSNAEMEDVAMNVPALPCCVLRLPMVYGPGDYLHRLYPILKRINDARQVIPIADTVAQWRSPRGYVEDVAFAILLAAEKAESSGHIFNVAEQESYSEAEWAKRVAEKMGWRGTIVTVPFASAPEHLRLPGNFAQHGNASSHRVRERLGYREITPPDLAVQRTIDGEQAHPPQPLPQFDYAAEDAAIEQNA